MKKLISTTLFCAVLAACTPPAATQFNGDSVTIRSSTSLDSERAAIDAEAARICGLAGKRAEYASTRNVGELAFDNFYLCL